MQYAELSWDSGRVGRGRQEQCASSTSWQRRASSAPAARQRSHIISKIFWMPVTAQPLLGSLMGECKGQVPGLEKTATLTCLHLTSASQALALLTPDPHFQVTSLPFASVC